MRKCGLGKLYSHRAYRREIGDDRKLFTYFVRTNAETGERLAKGNTLFKATKNR